jgi:hypothetical protein
LEQCALEIVLRRFDRLCEVIAASPRLRSATCAADPPRPVAPADALIERLPCSVARALLRSGEQAVSNGLYGNEAGGLPGGAAAPAFTIRDRLVTPLQSLTPLQQIALDILMAV